MFLIECFVLPKPNLQEKEKIAENKNPIKAIFLIIQILLESYKLLSAG